MRKLIFTAMIIVIGAGTAFVASHVVSGSTPYATPYDADVNHDGMVSAQDAQFVWSQFKAMAHPPLPTATPPPAATISGHTEVYRSAAGVQLIDPAGTIVQTYPGATTDAMSCDGRRAVLTYDNGNTTGRVDVIDTTSGAVLATTTRTGPMFNPSHSMFPCPLSRGSVPDRAVIAWMDWGNGSFTDLTVLDLTNGQVVATDRALSALDTKLTCANDAVAYPSDDTYPSLTPPYEVKMMSLVDGAIFFLQTGGNLLPTC